MSQYNMMQEDSKNTDVEYRTSYALDVVMARFNISKAPTDERQLRALFANVFRYLVNAVVQQANSGQPAAESTETYASDDAVLQVMNQMYEIRPEWREQRTTPQSATSSSKPFATSSSKPSATSSSQPSAKSSSKPSATSSSKPSATSSSQPSAVSSSQPSATSSSKPSATSSSQPSAASSSSQLSAVSSLSSQSSATSSSSSSTRRQNNQRRYTCTVCGIAFGYKHVLQNHERTHSGERPYQCDVCGQTFRRCHHLKAHLRMHTGEKPYLCQHCFLPFVQVANLRRHLKSHTTEHSHPCEHCNVSCTTAVELKAHVRTHKKRGKTPKVSNLATVPVATVTTDQSNATNLSTPVCAVISAQSNASTTATATNTIVSRPIPCAPHGGFSRTARKPFPAWRPLAARSPYPVRLSPPPAHLRPPQPAHPPPRPVLVWIDPVHGQQYSYPTQAQSLDLSDHTSRVNATRGRVRRRKALRPTHIPRV